MRESIQDIVSSVVDCALTDIMTSLLRRVSILVVVCSLLAEGLLVEAKGGSQGRGRGRSRGGYSYGGGGYSFGAPPWDFPVWAIALIIIVACLALAACCCDFCEILNEDENER